MLYTAAEVSANLVGPGENPGAGNLIPSHGEARHLVVPTTVGGMLQFRAYVGGSLVATQTCQVTAAAWQDDSEPLVALYDTDGYYIDCDGF
jgi:hypothetical protein